MRSLCFMPLLVLALAGGPVLAQLEDGPRWKMDEVMRDPSADYPATEERGTGMSEGVPVKLYKRPDAGAYIFNPGGYPPTGDQAACLLRLDHGRAYAQPYYPGYSIAAVVEAEAIAQYRMERDLGYTGLPLHTTCWCLGDVGGWLINHGNPTFSRVYGDYYLYSPTFPKQVAEDVPFNFTLSGEGRRALPGQLGRHEVLLQEGVEVTQRIRLNAIYAEAHYEAAKANNVDVRADTFFLRVETVVGPEQ